MSDNPSQWVGQVVDGKFELQEYLGGSAGSWVFLTERGGKTAAVKLIAADLKHRDALFSRLSRAAELSHPNLIRLFEMGRSRIDGAALIYVVMEYAEENLGEVLSQRALTPTETAEMLPPVLEALAYLHGKGLAHGQLKPSNILASGNQVKLSSDGICAIGEPRSRSGGYDAPEVATRGYSAPADIWSLGATLVQTLTQQVPRFEQNDTGSPTLPSSLPQPFLDIARNCLQRDPQRRWKIVQISSRLQPTSAATQAEISTMARVERTPSAKPTKPPSQWRHAVPAAILLALAVVVILVAPKILNRLQGHAASTASERAAPEATTEKTTEAPQSSNESTIASNNRSSALAHAESEVSANAASESAGPGEVTHEVVPDVPQKARDTIQGTVKVGVRVQVDAAGNVIDASLEAPGPSKYFGNLAMSAARQWKFAETNPINGSREWLLRFQFTQDGTKVFSTPSRPLNQ